VPAVYNYTVEMSRTVGGLNIRRAKRKCNELVYYSLTLPVGCKFPSNSAYSASNKCLTVLSHVAVLRKIPVARYQKEVQKLAEVDLNYSSNSRKRKFLIRLFSAATSCYRYPPL